MQNSVPYAKSENKSNLIPKQEVDRLERHLMFSFESLKTNEYYNMDYTCEKWGKIMIDALYDLSQHNYVDVIQNRFTKYRVHPLKSAHDPAKLPPGVNIDDMHQIRFDKSNGGIGGIFRENVFYVVLLDPLHNIYPNDHFGGKKKIKPAENCCEYFDEVLIEQQTEIENLKNDLKVYEEIDIDDYNKYLLQKEK